MVANLQKIADDWRFQTLILLLILFNAALLGVETDPDLKEQYGGTIHVLEGAVLAIFIAELVIRIGACGPRYATFFKDGWNIFDFAVVVVSLLPAIGPLGAIARMARVLRVVRLLEYSKQLRLIVDTLLRSIPSMGHVVMLLAILLYVFAILGINLFRDPEDPENMRRWGSLGIAVWTLFQTLTFENWVGVQDPLTAKYWWAPFYFLFFILIGVFVAMNLFIALVMNNLEEVKAEHEAEALEGASDVMVRINRVQAELAELEKQLQAMSAAATKAKSKNKNKKH